MKAERITTAVQAFAMYLGTFSLAGIAGLGGFPSACLAGAAVIAHCTVALYVLPARERFTEEEGYCRAALVGSLVAWALVTLTGLPQ